jgi:hypothetical protein
MISVRVITLSVPPLSIHRERLGIRARPRDAGHRSTGFESRMSGMTTECTARTARAKINKHRGNVFIETDVGRTVAAATAGRVQPRRVSRTIRVLRRAFAYSRAVHARGVDERVERVCSVYNTSRCEWKPYRFVRPKSGVGARVNIYGFVAAKVMGSKWLCAFAELRRVPPPRAFVSALENYNIFPPSSVCRWKRIDSARRSSAAWIG